METFSSIRTKIILGTVLTVAFLAAALVLGMFQVMNILGETILQRTMPPMARTAALAVQGNLHVLVERILLARDNEVFVDPASSLEEKQSALDITEFGTEFVWLGLFSPEGQRELGPSQSPLYLDDNLFSMLKKTRNLVIRDILASTMDIEIIIGAPIIRSGTIINYLVGSYKYDVLNDILGTLNISADSTAYIINANGKFMAHRDSKRVRYGDSLYSDYNDRGELNKALEKMSEDHIGSLHLRSGNYDKILSFAPIRGTMWFLVIEVPWDSFIAPIQRSIIISIFIILAMLLVLTLIIYLVISHFLTDPLKFITENTNNINRGIFGRSLLQPLILRNDEIGQLARASVSMSGSIERVITEIEQITRAAGEGRLNQRAELSGMEGDFRKIVSGVNSALDVICSHLDAIPVALALFNEKKEMLYRNQAMDELLLMHDLDIEGENLLEQIAGSGSFSSDLAIDPQVVAVFDSTLPKADPFVADIALLGHNGGSNFSLNIQRISQDVSKSGSVCVIMLASDVTMLTRAKIDAEMASRTKSDFLSRMSHEIRTPMNAVMGMTQIAKGSQDIQKIHSCLDQVENSSRHLLGVINDILDFSKMESGKLQLDITDFSLSENLNFVLAMMAPKAAEKNIKIQLLAEDITNDLISTDSLRLNQVLINLLSNAIKFSQEGSEVVLKVRELDSKKGLSSYAFEVIDHGIGISEFQASKLFKPFEQADGSITRNYGGSGLGLVISKNLVEMMGGKITLESREGEGSTFRFYILCSSKRSEGKRPPGPEAPKGSDDYNFSGKRCLLVDDIEINRDIIIELLSSTNLEIEPAENGQEALEKFISGGAGHFDIVLMDMQMPVMDGCTATGEIRRIEREWALNNPSLRETSIVAMSANVMQEDIKKALDSGMNAHLGKPIVLEETLKTIQQQFLK